MYEKINVIIVTGLSINGYVSTTGSVKLNVERKKEKKKHAKIIHLYIKVFYVVVC